MSRHPDYSVHPVVAYQQAIVENLPARTGRTVEQWVRLVREEGPEGSRERRAWLKTEHGVGGTTALVIVDQAEGGESGDPEAYLRAAPGWVDAMYAGPKAHLRPVHDRLVELALGLGPDVRACPMRTIVPLYRHHVFAEIKPATRRRIDLGLALGAPAAEPPPRLVPTGGAERGDRITHRIPLAAVGEVDAEVERRLRRAYELDA